MALTWEGLRLPAVAPSVREQMRLTWFKRHSLGVCLEYKQEHRKAFPASTLQGSGAHVCVLRVVPGHRQSSEERGDEHL